MRYTGPKCRLCRRAGVKLFLKGERCETQKCAITKRGTKPGAHPRAFGKVSEYGRQLRAKQMAKRIFGTNERQFQNLYEKASASEIPTATYMMRALEMRADNVLYRSGIASSRSEARQMISHGLFELNGRRIYTPSIALRLEDELAPSEKAAKNNHFAGFKIAKDNSPKWLSLNPKKFSVKVIALPEEDDFEQVIETRLIVEYYSRT